MLDSLFMSVAEDAGSWLGVLAQAASDAAQTATDGAQTATGAAAEGADAAASGAADGAGATAADRPAPGIFESVLRNPLTLFAGLMFLFYALVLMPERRKQAEAVRKRSALKKNDRVVTSGGIFGTVVAAAPDSDEITLRVDDSNNTRLRVTRASIATVLTSDKDKKEDAAG